MWKQLASAYFLKAKASRQTELWFDFCAMAVEGGFYNFMLSKFSHSNLYHIKCFVFQLDWNFIRSYINAKLFSFSGISSPLCWSMKTRKARLLARGATRTAAEDPARRVIPDSNIIIPIYCLPNTLQLVSPFYFQILKQKFCFIFPILTLQLNITKIVRFLWN